MKTKIAAFLILVALVAPAHATERSAILAGGVRVTLHDTPCSNAKVLAMLKPEYIPVFQHGVAVFPDRTLELCWNVTLEPGDVFIVDEEGDFGPIPLRAFAPSRI